MTPDRYEDIEFEMGHELGNAEQREINRRVQRALASDHAPAETPVRHCPAHDVTTPCHLCAGDHLAGAHLFGSHEATCARCATPAPTIPTAQLDAMSLAAGDDTLTDPDETRTASEGTER